LVSSYIVEVDYFISVNQSWKNHQLTAFTHWYCNEPHTYWATSLMAHYVGVLALVHCSLADWCDNDISTTTINLFNGPSPTSTCIGYRSLVRNLTLTLT